MFVIEIPYMNLEQIYNSKQVPRWIRLNESKYIVIHKDKALKIEQKKDRFTLNCSEEEFFKIWFEYFDLATDYMEANNQVKRIGKKFKIVANRGQGIHIVNQDTFESYVYSNIVLKVGFEKAKKAINHIANTCGIKHVQSMREVGKITWYEFPTPEMIIEKFERLGKMGSVNKWLKDLCEKIIYEGFTFEVDNELCKVFVNHDTNVFPLIGIEEVLSRNFDCDVEDFSDTFLNGVENKGVAYLYILHHKLNPPKEMK